MNIQITIVFCLLLGMTVFNSCENYLKIDPPINKIISEQVYSNDETAISAIRGIYAKMMSGGGFASGGARSVTLLAGRSADEFINYYTLDDTRRQFSNNDILPINSALQSGLWNEPYQVIFAVNSLIENISQSSKLTPHVKSQILGEAKFLRAFSYFYLANLFGNVPLVLSTDYRINATLPASPVEEIFSHLIEDLIEARDLLPADYTGIGRTRANKWSASALLARAYLYVHDYENAEKYADEVISQNDFYTLESNLKDVFLTSSKEAILQFFVPAIFNNNTNEGSVFILIAAPGASTEVALNEELYNSFDDWDNRRIEWVGKIENGSSTWHYPFKYKIKTGAIPSTEYSMVLRLAEQYLIRAEARIELNRIASGIMDLNSIRDRAKQSTTENSDWALIDLPITMSKSDALAAVESERRKELFAEWGHRWLDLKRTGRVDTVIGDLKPLSWEDTDQLFPIPYSELQNNPNLQQNPGYN